VLNTYKMLLSGESFDYGPFALEVWDPGFTAAYFDHSGLYAFGEQLLICHQNLRRACRTRWRCCCRRPSWRAGWASMPWP
jgi:uncharacterized protein YdiU (UPF0061 family)